MLASAWRSIAMPRAGRARGPRRILYLGTGQIAQIAPRNGANLFLERECSDFDGYFEQLWNVHFPAGARGKLDLSPRHHLVDFDLAPTVRRAGLLGLLMREGAFLVWLIYFVRRHNVTMLAATNPYLQGINAAIASAATGIPFSVLITRDFDWDWSVLKKQAFSTLFPSRRVEKLVERIVLTRASLVLADRRYYRDFALRNGAAADRTIATRVLADTAYDLAAPITTVRARLGLEGCPLMLYVGRLDPDKRPFDLVDCLFEVRKVFPSALLACAGMGQDVTALMDRARQLGVQAGLKLLGTLQLAELASLQAEAEVIVAPHMGYTLIEAGMTGAPIVTYDFDYHPEIIRDGESGYLAPFADQMGLAAQVCQALNDPAAATQKGARLRRRMRTEHSRSAVIPRYVEAYATVLGGS